MNDVVAAISHQSLRTATRIYVPVTLLALALAIAGFWRTYFGPLLGGTIDQVAIIHLHAAVYTGWLLLVIAQGCLAAVGRTALHVRIGNVGMAYGALVILVGLATAYHSFALRIDAGRIEAAQRGLLIPLSDMIVFSSFLATAWRYRSRPEIHKRLIIVATTTLIIAGVGRMPFWHGTRIISFREMAPFLLVWLSPIYIAMASDYVRRRVVHPVYLIGIVCLCLLRLRVLVRDSDWWMSLSGWLVELYL